MIRLPLKNGFLGEARALIVGVLSPWVLLGFATTMAQESGAAGQPSGKSADKPAELLFARDNLIAWCIVPFDSKKRRPEERAAMLQRLGFKHFAYDWRAEHIPSFDAEVGALKRHGIALDGFWVAPGELNRESRIILELLKRHGIKAQLWVLLDLGGDRVSGAEQERRIAAAVAKLQPLAIEAEKIGCTLALYNHGGWFGEPENQIAIIERLKGAGVEKVGMVYNLHHGHDHLDRFPALLQTMIPYLKALNLNGMDEGGDKVGRKILPLGQGERDLDLLRIIRDSGYRGPIGILGHTEDDAEARLRDNLDGLDWLLPQLDGKPPGPQPKPRTPVTPRPAKKVELPTKEAIEVATLVAEARKEGDSRRGAEVFLDARFSCISCHKVGTEGGIVGPELTTAGACLSPEEIAESVLWPRRKIKEGYEAIALATDDGKVIQGYPHEQDRARDRPHRGHDRAQAPDLPGRRRRDSRGRHPDARGDRGHHVGPRAPGSRPVPDGAGKTRRFLVGTACATTPTRPATFPFDRAAATARPLAQLAAAGEPRADLRLLCQGSGVLPQAVAGPAPLAPLSRARRRDLTATGVIRMRKAGPTPRWNETALGTVLCGVFRGAGVTVPKGVCVRLGDRNEMSACFNPETLSYEALWRDGFVRFSATRHGFLDGLILSGTPLPRPEGTRPDKPFTYRGFYRHGPRVIFAYRIGSEEYLDSAWVEDGKFTRRIVPASELTLARLTQGGPSQWPEVLTTARHSRPDRSLRHRHDRAAAGESVEGPPVLRRS